MNFRIPSHADFLAFEGYDAPVAVAQLQNIEAQQQLKIRSTRLREGPRKVASGPMGRDAYSDTRHQIDT